jgi:hypothetical protein
MGMGALLCMCVSDLQNTVLLWFLFVPRFVVNKPYAIISSSLTFWIPVMVMLTLYHRYNLKLLPHVCSPFTTDIISNFCHTFAYTYHRYDLKLLPHVC